ncbi:MAG: hypothetical protein E7Z87_06600 [Cyanobacteria bacterium SIG26]|nr:hypothetical protein [Cyanobacteria bacterium SIG26]
MKKRYIFGAVVILLIIQFLVILLISPDENSLKKQYSVYPRFGQKIWTFNMNKHEWRNYHKNDDELSKEEIILQVKGFEGNGGYTTYQLLTGNAQVPKEDVWVGEGSQEFLKGTKLYSYFPKNFEYYELIFNGVKFVPRELEISEIETLFNNYKIIKISDLINGNNTYKMTKKQNKFIVINDIGEDFYKYYIIPNDSKKMQIGQYSNQFSVSDSVEIRLQRLEGCTKAYPCFDIVIK